MLKRHFLPQIYGENFSLPGGQFNNRYCVHFQILGPSEVPGVEVKAVGPSNKAAKILTALWNRAADTLLSRVENTEDSVWTRHKMGGAQYEHGYFEYMVMRATLRDDLVTGRLDRDVRLLPDYKLEGAKPETVPMALYYICPAAHESATRDMLELLADGKEAPRQMGEERHVGSHRGIGLSQSATELALGAERKTVGAGEIYQSVFWFTDETTFRRACKYLGVPVSPQTMTSKSSGPVSAPR